MPVAGRREATTENLTCGDRRMLFTKYTIATRIILLVSVMLFLMLVLVGVEIRGMNNIRGVMD